MQQYKDLLKRVIENGVIKPNRTGVDTLGIIGAHMAFDLSDGFPIVTLKKTYWKKSVAEMLGFLRGYNNASQFRELGCDVWDQNANENEAWVNNPNRKGIDDLGRIYGVQARKWGGHIDQLRKVYTDIKNGIDDRREIVSHWNPSDMAFASKSRMALPPCHLLYQFGIQGDELHLSMYQRSADMGLGVPFNIVGYSWLLMVMAKITGLKPGTFNHFLHDVHIYVNHLEGVQTMLDREVLTLPQMEINKKINTLKDLEKWVKVDDFSIINYSSHDPIKLPMAV